MDAWQGLLRSASGGSIGSIRSHGHPTGRIHGLFEQEYEVKTRTISTSAVVLALAMGLGACSNMSRQDKGTAVGAAIGGVAGSVLTGGSTAGTVGGAIAGGVIGHETQKGK